MSFEEQLASRTTVMVNAIAATAAAPMRNIRRWSGDAVNITEMVVDGCLNGHVSGARLPPVVANVTQTRKIASDAWLDCMILRHLTAKMPTQQAEYRSLHAFASIQEVVVQR